MIQGHFEAKKHAYRQNDKGFFVTLFIHPQDLSPDFVLAAIGTRFQIGYAEMDDNEIPSHDSPVMPGVGGGDTTVTSVSAVTTAEFNDEIPDWRN